MSASTNSKTNHNTSVQERRQQGLRRHQERLTLYALRAVVDTMAEHVCVLDEAAQAVITNRAWRDHAARTGHGLWVAETENFLAACAHLEGPDSFDATAIATLVQGALTRVAADYAFVSGSGPTARHFKVRISHLDDASPGCAILSMLDVTASVAAEERVRYLTQFDDITGLPNRDLFRDRLTQTLKHAERNGWLVAVVAIDLDHFRSVNDAHGHRAGDRLLALAAQRIQRRIREGETIGRIEGDEFGMTLSDLARAEDAGQIAHAVQQTLSEPFELNDEQVFITASVGIALFPNDGGDPHELWKNATAAKERAKKSRRGDYQFYNPQMTGRTTERIKFERELRGAQARGELELHYQPKVEVAGHKVSGFEALLRWRHPERGLIAPADFIPWLEETGLILPVGEWVVATVCAQIRQWQAESVTVCPVAVNLSARQFEQVDLDERLGAIIAAHGIDPALIELEVTESMLMHDPEQAAATLRRLRAAGLRIAIDDFGTGYSSLAYLPQFPLDALKIDRAFIREVAAGPEQAMLAKAIIQLAHNLKLKVVAEGVETEAQFNFLARQCCDEVQGYYFSRPVPAAQCPALLSALARHIPVWDTTALPKLVILDDDPNDLELMSHTLRDEGYAIETTSNPETAFALLAAHRVAIVISDHKMPSTTGVRFLAAVRELYPDTVRIIATSNADTEDLTVAINDAAIHKFISKDWVRARICATTTEAYRLYGGA